MTIIIADWLQRGAWLVRTMTRPHLVTTICFVSLLHLASPGQGVTSSRGEQGVAATEDAADAAAGGVAQAEEPMHHQPMSLIRLRHRLHPHQAAQSSSQPPVTHCLAWSAINSHLISTVQIILTSRRHGPSSAPRAS